VNEFRAVMKTLKRLSRLYPEELTEHFIYLPAVTLEQLATTHRCKIGWPSSSCAWTAARSPAWLQGQPA
jgi:hypothetical protein